MHSRLIEYPIPAFLHIRLTTHMIHKNDCTSRICHQPSPTNRTRLTLALIAISIALNASPSLGWGGTAHSIINAGAVTHLPASMKQFIDQKAYFSAHASDADNRKSSYASEAKKHFIDIDYYPNFKTFTHDYDSAVARYGLSTIETNGIVPWAALWMYDTLVNQLKRRDWTKAYQSAADLGHYIGDCNIALHATVNYNGQLSGNTGIHSRYETGIVGQFQQELTIVKDSVMVLSRPIDVIFSCVLDVNSYVDSIMAADNKAQTASGWDRSGIPPNTYYTSLWKLTGPFTKAHIQRSSVVLARLWYSAWQKAGLLPTTSVQPMLSTIQTCPVNSSTYSIVQFNLLGRQMTLGNFKRSETRNRAQLYPLILVNKVQR